MSFRYIPTVQLGEDETGLLGTVAYRVRTVDDQTTVIAPTTAGVTADDADGAYIVRAGIILPDEPVVISWYDGVTWRAREVVDPAWMNSRGAGLHTILISVQDEDAIDIENAYVTIMDATDTVQEAWSSTGSPHAPIPFHLNASTYMVRVNAGSNYQPEPPYTLVVTGDAAVTLFLTGQSPIAPATGGLCAIYDWVHQENNFISDCHAQAKPAGLPQSTTAGMLDGERRVTDTEEDGKWTLQLAIGKKYRISVPRAGVDVEVLVPNQGSAWLTDILGLPTV